MDNEKANVTYERIKKRVSTYKKASYIFQALQFILAMLFIFSLVPIIPAALDLLFDTSLLILWWPICLVAFGILLYISNRVYNQILSTRRITLEEMLYVIAFETLKLLDEYLDSVHPVAGSKNKAVRKLQSMSYLLESTDWQIPNISILKDGAEPIMEFRNNLITRLTPSIRGKDKGKIEKAYSALKLFLDFLAQPQISGLIKTNKELDQLPPVSQRGILSSILMRPMAKNLLAFSFITAIAVVVYCVDIFYMNPTPHEALSLFVATFIGGAGVYVTYLTLKSRK